MADMRSCIKTGCRWPAAATLSYRYTTAEVWLSDLAEDHPSTHDLCPHHADTMRVPRGWSLVDDRQPSEAVHEPSAAEIVERVATLRGSVDRMLERDERHGAGRARHESRSSRYTRLLADLPTYDPPTDPEHEDARRETTAGPAMVSVGLSHEIAPVPSEMATVSSVLGRRHEHTTRRDHGSTDGPDHLVDRGVASTDAISLDGHGSDSGVDRADAHTDADEVTASGDEGDDQASAGRDDEDSADAELQGAVVLSLPLRLHEDAEV